MRRRDWTHTRNETWAIGATRPARLIVGDRARPVLPAKRSGAHRYRARATAPSARYPGWPSLATVGPTPVSLHYCAGQNAVRWPTPRSITSESDTTGTSPPIRPCPATRNPFPQPATRNPFSFLVRKPSSHERQSPLVGPPRCFVAHHPLSPRRACRSGTSCLSLRLIPPPSQNRPQSHHSIPHPHPSIHSSRPVLVYPQRPSSPNTTACVRLTTTSRQDGQDERSALASRAASTTSTVARLNRHRRRERFTWLSPTTARPTRNSGRHIEPRHRRRQPRRRQRQRWSDASLHCPPRPASRPEPLRGWTVVRSGRLLPRQHPLSARMFHHDRVATALRR